MHANDHVNFGQAAVDLSHRGVIRVDGPDRLTWLHSLNTQHLSDLAPRVPVQALVLSPHGHIEHDLHLVDDGQAAWITVEPGTAGDLVAFLEALTDRKVLTDKRFSDPFARR